MKSPLSITGGESVYCINESQLRDATRLAHEAPTSAPRIHGALDELERTLPRNERAALAFMLIERLRTSKA